MYFCYKRSIVDPSIWFSIEFSTTLYFFVQKMYTEIDRYWRTVSFHYKHIFLKVLFFEHIGNQSLKNVLLRLQHFCVSKIESRKFRILFGWIWHCCNGWQNSLRMYSCLWGECCLKTISKISKITKQFSSSKQLREKS